METQFEGYNYSEFIATTFSCIKCSNCVSVSISTNCTDHLLNEMAKSFLCINCNNNLVDQQNIIQYINEQMSYITRKNYISFSKVHSKIMTLGNNLYKLNSIKEPEFIEKKIENIDKKIQDIDKKFILNNFLLTNLIKKSQNEIISLNVYVDKNDETISNLVSKYDNIIESKKEFVEKLSNESKECTNMCNTTKKNMERMNVIVKLLQSKLSENFNKSEKNIHTKINTYQDEFKSKYENLDTMLEKYYIRCSELEDKYKKMDNEMNLNFQKFKNDFEEKYKDLDENIKSYYMKNKELKELKKSLILNDKEYKSFKNHIKKINTNLIYFYLLIGFNMLFFLFSIYTFLK